MNLAAALAAVYVIWGSTYLVMRWAVAEFPPMLMGSARFLCAGAILLVLAKARGEGWPSWRQLAGAALIGGLLFVGGNGGVAIAEQSISSGVAAVVAATMPLWMAAMVALSGQMPRGRDWLGLGFGFVGVVVLSSGAELRADPTAALILCGSPLAWAAGSLAARRLGQPKGLMAPAIQMLAGGVLMWLTGAALGEAWPRSPSTESIMQIAYLAVFGSVIGFTAYSWLLAHARPAIATSYAYVNPVLAIFFGALLGNEHLGVATLVATPMIVGAVALILLDQRRD